MKKLRVFETFAGIGAQHKALQRLKEAGVLDYEVVATSEWDIDAIIAYNAIHDHAGEYSLNRNCNPKDYTFSSDGKVPITNIERLTKEKRKLLYKACEENRNYGSIVELQAHDLPNFDLLTYSFPCQDLSIASMGRGKGMGREAESRSGLLWEIERVLKEKEYLAQSGELNFMGEVHHLPKYLLLENVSAMLHKNNIEHYEEWLRELELLGYYTVTTKLRSDNFGIPQKRERVFAISIKMDETFNKAKLDEYFNFEENDNFVTKIEKTKEKIYESRNYNTDRLFTIEMGNREPLQGIINEGSNYLNEMLLSSPNHTKSRYKMRNENFKLEDKNVCFVRTLTTKQDRHPNAGMIEFKHGKALDIFKNEVDREFRFLTQRECYMLMGFDSEDYSKVFHLFDHENNKYKQSIIRKEKMYQQAGNSIVVNVLEAIFKTIWEIDKI